MKRTHVIVLALVLLVSGFTFAQQSPSMQPSPSMSQPSPQAAPSVSSDQDRAQIQSLVQQLDQAAINNDTAFLARTLAPNYQAVNAQGVTETRGDILKAHRDDDIKYETINEREQDIQIAGDTATEHGTTDIRGVYKGQHFDGTYTSTRTFQRQPDGSWQIVGFEVHKVK